MAGNAPIGHLEDWSVVRLGDIAVKIGSGATPRGGADNYLAARDRFALIRSQNVFDRRFDSSGLAFISDEQAKGLQNVLVEPDDLLINITGDGITFARCCRVPSDVLPACVNQHVSIIRVNQEIADPGYVLAFLTHPTVKTYIESFNAGGSRRAITKGHIESFRLPLPPRKEQSRIAHILGTLDDKIELNRRMNETLEAMARALFKSWFVDFDPVRAKAAGRDPGLPKDLADLFPDSVVDSALGPIPKGWHALPMGEIASMQREAINPGVFPEEIFDHYSIPAYDEGREPKTEAGEGIKSIKFQIPAEAILVSKLNPRFPRVWLPDLSGVRHSICSTEFIVLVPKRIATREYLYCLCISDWLFDTFSTMVTGTSSSHQRVKPDDLLRMRVVIPNHKPLTKFSDLMAPLLRQVIKRTEQSRTLACVRDVLLPKLISGEIRVKDAERIAGVA